MRRFFLIIAVILVTSCVQEKKLGNIAEIKTSSVRATSDEFSVDGGLDRGEFLIGGDTATITARVTNTSAYTFKNLLFTIVGPSTAAMKFAPASNGVASSPGFGGTCKLELAAGESCTYVLHFNPTNMGSLSQNLSLSYINLVEPVKKSLRLNFFVGDYSNIVEVNEQIRHDFGRIERIDQSQVYEKIVEIQNVGGLTARNLSIETTNLAEGAYSIAENTCGSTLKAKAKCLVKVRLRSPNYLLTDLSNTYTSDLRIEYNKNPISAPSEKAVFSYGFLVYSTKLEGILAVSGSPGFAYDNIVHGNKIEKIINVKNKGVIDLILRKIIVYDGIGNVQGICGRVGSSGAVSCVDGSLSPVTLLSFPFSFNDTNNCLVDSSLGDYDRDTITGEYSNYTPPFISPPSETVLGEECAFKVFYHSSITNTANTDFSNWVIGFEFDNTFGNTKEIVTTTPFLGAHFTITSAKGLMGAVLTMANYSLNSTVVASNPSSPYIYDMGRVSLIQSTSTYYDLIKYGFKNTVPQSPFILKTLTTESNTSGTNVVLNNNSAKAINSGVFPYSIIGGACKIGIAYKNPTCDFSLRFAPKITLNPAHLIGPLALAAGKDVREFVLSYNNGCKINDNGTPCSDKYFRFNFKATPISRGSLQFNTVKSGGGSGALPRKTNIGATFVGGIPLAGETTWYYLWLDNIGGGSVTYLKTLLGYSFKSTYSPAPYPFAIVPDSTGLLPGEADCYNYFRGSPDLNATFPLEADPLINFAANTRCRLKVESKFYANEKIANYGSAEWKREFYVDRPENREHVYQAAFNQNLHLDYYDGDITTPTPTSNFVTNFGEKLSTLGGSLGKFLFKSTFAYRGRIAPMRPLPVVSSILYRPGFSLPAVPKDPNSQMAALSGQTVAPHVLNLQIFASNYVSYPTSGSSISMAAGAGVTGLPGVGTREAFGHLNTNYPFSNYTGYDYVYYAGSFPAESGQEYLGSFSLDNSGYGAVTNFAIALTCDVAPQGCASTSNTIRLSPEPVLSTLAALSGSTSVLFKLTPLSALDVGSHEATLTINFKNPMTQVLRIKVLFNVIANDAKKIRIVATDYECNFGTDPSCASPTATFSSNDITGLFLYNYAPNSGTRMVAVAGSPVGVRKKLTITNMGTENITDIKVFFKDGSSGAKVYYEEPQGYSITPKPNNLTLTPTSDQYHCQSAGQVGILLVGDSCNVNINFKPTSYANLPKVLVVGYRNVDGAGIRGSYINQMLDYLFVGDNQANLVIDQAPSKTFSYMAQNVISYPVRFGNFTQSNHPVLSSFPTTTFDSVPLINSPALELFNQRVEKASLLKQYEIYATDNALPMTPPVQAWTRIYEPAGSEIAVEANQGCFYGADYLNAAIDADKKGFYSNDIGLSSSCRVRVLYTIGLAKKGFINSANNIIPLKYYSNRRLVTKTIYLHLEGFVEPYRSISPTETIKDVKVSNNGSVQFSWDNFTNETADFGDIDRYRVFYSKYGSDLVKIFESSYPNTLAYEDSVGTNATIDISDLEPGRYYYFQVVGVRIDPSDNNEYLSMPTTFYRQKVLVPPPGMGFDFNTSNLIELSLSGSYGGETVTKVEAVLGCSNRAVILKDDVVTINKPLGLMTVDVYENIIESEVDELVYPCGEPA